MSPRWESAEIDGGGKVEFDVEMRMEGGMKHVYFSRDRSSVVAFFHNTNDQALRESRLLKVVNQFNPTRAGQANADYWSDLFCWPSAILRHKTFGMGIKLPVYSSCFRFQMGELKGCEKDGGWFNCMDRKTNRLMRYSKVHESERGNLQTYLAVFIRVARAVSRMHNAGLAHADLSERNVLIDPSTGRAVIIDLDSLVVTGMYPPEVLGTPGYIAPEVMATKSLPLNDPRRKHPCAETDKYALAVMIHKYLLERHPLEGRRVFSGASAEQEEENAHGVRALYSEHPQDQANRPIGDDWLRSAILGQKVEELFRQTFVDGLVDPRRRPAAGEWETALDSAFGMLLACPNPNCTHKFFVVTNAGQPKCPYCKSLYRGTYSILSMTHEEKGFTRSEGQLVLNGFRNGSGTRLYRFHLHRNQPRGAAQDNTAVLQVVFLEKPAPTFYLQNLALPGMQVRMKGTSSDTFQPIPISAKVQLASGLEIIFGQDESARKGTVETRHFL